MTDPRITWAGPLTDPSGAAAQGRAFVRGLVEAGTEPHLQHRVWHWREAVTPPERERLADLMEHPGTDPDVHIQHTHARLLDPYVRARLRIGRTRWDVDAVPADAMHRVRQMDEVWVPSGHVADALTRHGADPDRVWVLPEPVELDRFTPGAVPAMTVPDAHGTVFLAILEWGGRSGWDVLLDAWLRAFDDTDDVTMVLKTWSLQGLDDAAIQAALVDHVRHRGHDPARMADLVVVTDLLDTRRLPMLYAAADVCVVPARATGFSRVAAEAMASGVPVVAAAAGGLADQVCGEVGWVVPHRDVAVGRRDAAREGYPADARWSEPDPGAMAEALRAAYADPGARAARGTAARAAAGALDHTVITRAALHRLAQVSPARGHHQRAVRPGVPRVLLAGSVFGAHSLAGVNRELARALVREGRVELGLLDTERAALGTGHPDLAALAPLVDGLLPDVDVTIRHGYPPCFDAGAPGRVVQVLHWEYGPVPVAWVHALRRGVDEVWVASSWVADGMRSSGVPEERCAVVPLGVDPSRFRPGLDPLPLGDAAPGFRFLFVGGLLWRKGVDLLLDAYERAFTRTDDVTLVVKDFGASGPYVPQDLATRIARMAADTAAPRVVHLTGALPEADMPRLYAAADCLVHPYRGEGYALPIAEAMACGLPAVVPDLGACRDYAGPGTAVLVPSRPAVMPGARVGGMQLAGRPTVVEVEVDDLAAVMRAVADDPAAHRALGARAAAHMHAHHTWDHTARAAAHRLLRLTGGAIAA